MEELIKKKANYCLNCKLKPCSTKGCPLNNNIPEFIKEVKEDNYENAYKILSETTVLQGVCGRICPHVKQCQGSCVRGIKGSSVEIGDLEAYVFDKLQDDVNSLFKCYEKEIKENTSNNNKKVAVIGGGPAGLTCAAFLARKGIKVTIYEKYDYLGGLMIHGIPDFRLPKKIVEKTINKILNLGIDVRYKCELGKDLSIEKLKESYDAIFLSIGANSSAKMGVEGESLEGVYGGNELLEYKIHPNYEGKKVAIIGGGNVAMDCARTIKRLGAKEVNVIYRRAKEQMPAEKKELDDAINEGVNFMFQNNIVKIFGKEKVEKVGLVKTKLIKKENEERLIPVNVENSDYTLDMDYVVMAIGSNPDKNIKKLGLSLNKWGRIQIDENYRTSDSKIYSGGDIAGVKATVAWAAKSGREAANKIIENI